MKKHWAGLAELLGVAVIGSLVAWSLSSRRIPDEPPSELRESVDHSDADVLGYDRSSQWTKVRNDFVAKHPVCEACGTSSQLNVHHIKPFHSNPELELSPSNLITLCREHHFRIGHDPDGPSKPLKPNWSAHNPMVRTHARQFRESR